MASAEGEKRIEEIKMINRALLMDSIFVSSPWRGERIRKGEKGKEEEEEEEDEERERRRLTGFAWK